MPNPLQLIIVMLLFAGLASVVMFMVGWIIGIVRDKVLLFRHRKVRFEHIEPDVPWERE